MNNATDQRESRVIPDFRREVEENCALLGHYAASSGTARAERDGTRAETRFRLSPKRTSPFKSVGASVQSSAGSRGVRISLSNAGYTTFGGSVRVLTTHSIRQFPLHFPSSASPCATRFRTSSNFFTNVSGLYIGNIFRDRVSRNVGKKLPLLAA